MEALLQDLHTKKSVVKRRGGTVYVDDLPKPQQIANQWGDLEEEEPDEAFFGTDDDSSKTIEELFGSEVFAYFEQHGSAEQLQLFLNFIQAYLDDEETSYNCYPIYFAVKNRCRDFVNLMVPTPKIFEGEAASFTSLSLMKTAVQNGDIEMVKLLMKYSEEKKVNIRPDCSHLDTANPDNLAWVNENLLDVATRLGHQEIVDLLNDVYGERIDIADLNPEI